MQMPEVTDNVRKIAFGVIAAALLVVAFFATRSSPPESTAANTQSAPAGPVINIQPNSPIVNGSSQDPIPPSVSAVPSDTNSVANNPAVTSPLPAAALSDAATAAQNFAEVFTAYSYTQNNAMFVTRVEGLLSIGSQVDVGALIPKPPAAQQLASDQTVITSKAAISSVVLTARTTAIFDVSVLTKTTTTKGAANSLSTYEISLTLSNKKWGVSNATLLDSNPTATTSR